MNRTVGVLVAVAALSLPVAATAAFVPFVFAPGPIEGTLEASVPFPQEPVLNDPRGYFLGVTGLFSTSVSYACGPIG